VKYLLDTNACIAHLRGVAAIALCHGLTLVTHNVQEFSRVSDLLWEDWEA
jgi:predicted nucleic acid-binding protein